MQVKFLGKDPASIEGESPTLFATDRTDRVTYIAQGWKVTDPEALAEIGPVPDHEALIEIPEDGRFGSRCGRATTLRVRPSRSEDSEPASRSTCRGPRRGSV
jgi:hypothetical protein